MTILRKIKIMTTAAMCLCMMAAVSSCVNDDEPENHGVLPGDPVPQFSVVTDAGETVSASSLRGKVGAIEFFNTTCPDCRRSFPVLQDLCERFADDPRVVVLAIARDEARESIEAYWKANSLSIPFSPQPDRKVYELFASTGIPRIFIISPDGTVAAAFGPEDQPTSSALAEAVMSQLPDNH